MAGFLQQPLSHTPYLQSCSPQIHPTHCWYPHLSEMRIVWATLLLWEKAKLLQQIRLGLHSPSRLQLHCYAHSLTPAPTLLSIF